MQTEIQSVLAAGPVQATAPCRIDMGGTLDISTFYYPLAVADPCTFNIALSMRTRVSIGPHAKGRVKISSRGFESADFLMEEVPFDHPLGLMFAIAAYFQVDGIHIHIESGSPPRSALGGSSAAAVALIGAFKRLLEKAGRPALPVEKIPLLAHGIEESVAGVPCGLQDQLAAVFGGVNCWHWRGAGAETPYVRQAVLVPEQYSNLSGHLLLAYCGIPHESRNINSQWVEQFVRGRFRSLWIEIARATQAFADAVVAGDIPEAVALMNRETAMRVEMTPDVFDATGRALAGAALDRGCGARFTGAGGGGCIWALGEKSQIRDLGTVWEPLLSGENPGQLLAVDIDPDGLLLEDPS